MLGFARDDGLAEIGAQHFPGGLPPIALDQTSQHQDGLPPARRPGHAGAFHPLRDQGFAGGFHDAAGNRQAAPEVIRIVHAWPLIPKVGQLGFQAFPVASACSTALILEYPNDLVRAVVGFLEQGLQAFKLSFAARGALAPGGVTPFFRWSQAW